MWSFYAGAGPHIKFLRRGTLDKHGVDGTSTEDLMRPDIFIFTKFKHPWVVYPEYSQAHVLIMEEYYDRTERWSGGVQERFLATTGKTEEWKNLGSRWGEAFAVFKDCR